MHAETIIPLFETRRNPLSGALHFGQDIGGTITVKNTGTRRSHAGIGEPFALLIVLMSNPIVARKHKTRSVIAGETSAYTTASARANAITDSDVDTVTPDADPKP